MRKYKILWLLPVALAGAGCGGAGGDAAGNQSTASGNVTSGGIEEMGPMGGGGGNIAADPANGTDGTGNSMQIGGAAATGGGVSGR